LGSVGLGIASLTDSIALNQAPDVEIVPVSRISLNNKSS